MEHRTLEIIELIKDYFEQFPDQRFGQILFNLDISQFKNKETPEKDNFLLRDIYSDTDSDIIERIENRKKLIEKKKPRDNNALDGQTC
jgi:hypothetical protein